ncbi:MAG: two-component sensor histidine kinase [Eubacterium sp.]|nr:two-component sensor histidine kinase [Eubacterium sp.]
MKKIRIKTFVLLSVMFLILISLLIVIFASVFFFRNSLIVGVKDETLERMTDVKTFLEKEGVDAILDDPSMEYRVSDDAEYLKGRVMIINDNYQILRDTSKMAEKSYIISDNVMKVMKGEEKKIQYDTQEDTVYIYPIHVDGRVAGVLFYRASLVPVTNRVEIMFKIELILMMILFLIDVVIVIAISRRSVKDINAVNEKIMHNSLGNLNERLPEDEGFIEIQILSENYNEVLEKLATIDQTRSEFVSNVSHELKTPITSMKVLAESITQNEGATAEDYKEFMTDIVDEIDRETKIINDLLTLVRTDSNSNEMNLEETDIGEMMETIIKTVRPLATQRDIELSFESYREVKADVDVVKLSLAISNLIENAVKYNVDNGWIKCSLNSDHKYFYIKVADSGVGIPEDAKERVFERFYRVDKARSRDTGGTGLGLSITRSIINAHKGTIKLYSESGKGTTFSVRIPLKKS